MSQVLSGSPGTLPRGVNRQKHVPFTCWLAYTPLDDQRMSDRYYVQQLCDVISENLEGVCDASAAVTFDYTKPIAQTVRFGTGGTTGFGAIDSQGYTLSDGYVPTTTQPRISFSGHLCARSTFTKTPMGERTVIRSGEYVTGAGATNARDEPATAMNTAVKDFKDLIETATAMTVIRIELANFIYGEGGSHFPQ